MRHLEARFSSLRSDGKNDTPKHTLVDLRIGRHLSDSARSANAG